MEMSSHISIYMLNSSPFVLNSFQHAIDIVVITGEFMNLRICFSSICGHAIAAAALLTLAHEARLKEPLFKRDP